MENQEETRTISVYMNSPSDFKFKNDTTWGEFKNLLIENNFPKQITGINDDDGTRYEKNTDDLPNGDISLSVLVTDTKYGN